MRSTRPRWRAGSRRAAGRRASGPAEGGRGSAQGAWRVRDCGRQLGAGCCAEATADRGPPRPHPPALAVARRVPEPTAPAPRARRPQTARTSARTCGLVTRTCGGWYTVGDAGWAVSRRSSDERCPTDGQGTVPGEGRLVGLAGVPKPEGQMAFRKGSIGLLGGASAGHRYSWGEWGFLFSGRRSLECLQRPLRTRPLWSCSWVQSAGSSGRTPPSPSFSSGS